FLNNYGRAVVSIRPGDGIAFTDNVIDGAVQGLEAEAFGPAWRGYSIENLEVTGNTFRNCQVGFWAHAARGGQFVNVTFTGNAFTNCRKNIDVLGLSAIDAGSTLPAPTSLPSAPAPAPAPTPAPVPTPVTPLPTT